MESFRQIKNNNVDLISNNDPLDKNRLLIEDLWESVLREECPDDQAERLIQLKELSYSKQIDGAALLFVSVLFIRNITDIEWNDVSESAPAILAMIAMPLTYSISNGIALAFVSYALIKIFTGKFATTSPAIWVIAILSVVSFAVA